MVLYTGHILQLKITDALNDHERRGEPSREIKQSEENCFKGKNCDVYADNLKKTDLL